MPQHATTTCTIMGQDNDIASETEHAAEEQRSAPKHDDEMMMAKSPSLVVSAASQSSCAPIGGDDDPSLKGTMDNTTSETSTSKTSTSKRPKRSRSSTHSEPITSTAQLVTRPNDTVVRDIEYSSHTHDMYQPSCIVELPAEAAAGDQLLIRWPARKVSGQGKKSKIETGDALTGNKCAKKEPSSTNSSSQSSVSSSAGKVNNSAPHKSSGGGGLLVRITVPSKLSVKKEKKGSPCCIKVLAPWLAAERAASNSLNTRQ